MSPPGRRPGGHIDGVGSCADTLDLRAADGHSVCFLQEADVEIAADHFAIGPPRQSRCGVGAVNGWRRIGSDLDGHCTRTHRCGARCRRASPPLRSEAHGNRHAGP